MNRNKTERIELVETHNLVLSIQHLRNIPGYDPDHWRRALYHALMIAHVDRTTIGKIREALNLP